jgi:hypothetical protein
MPFAKIVRYPIKLFSMGLFPCALLVGYTINLHFGRAPHDRHPISPSGRLVTFFWGITALLTGLVLMFLFSGTVASFIQERLFNRADDIVYHGLRSSLLHTTAIWIVATLVYQTRYLRKAGWQGCLLAGILVADLLTAGTEVNFYAPRTIFTDVPAIVPIIQQKRGDGRVFRSQSSGQHAGFRQIPDDMSWTYRWTLETLGNSSAAFFRIPIIFHIDFDRMALTHVMQLQKVITAIPWERRLPILSAGGVTLIISPMPLELPGLEFIGGIPNQANVPFYRYWNTRKADRVKLVTQWTQVETEPDALGIMLNSQYDPRKHVVLQRPESTLKLLFAPKQPSQDDLTPIAVNTELTQQFPPFEGSREPCAPAQINIKRASTITAHLSVAAQCDGYLVFSDPYYPGWQVSVDGKMVPILRANYAFSAVFLPAGEHDVTRRYRPVSLLIGAICLAGFCGLLFLVVYAGWLSRLLYR